MSRAGKQILRLSQLWPYAVTIFLGAFLLFQVQPMISKMILPWYGGSPSVWTTCMLFFQTLLVGGYAYAHFMSRLPGKKLQIGLHVCLLVGATLLLPVTPDESWKPDGTGNPTTEILWLLLVCAGLPYFLLSATGPLVQSWFSRAFANASPYRLFALSNAGSLLALISYPFFFEPQFPLDQQGIIWAIGFVVYAIACAFVAWKANATSHEEAEAPAQPVKPAKLNKADAAKHLPKSAWLLWIALPALASIALLAITNYVCQDIAVIPFLWIAPLGLYLLSFIICFERERWYSRRWYSLLTGLCILLICNTMLTHYMQGSSFHLTLSLYAKRIDVQIVMYLSALFLLCMMCHGELAKLKPDPKQLTSYYLAISIGGAIGGLTVALFCPLIFDRFYELNLTLIVGYILSLFVFIRFEWNRVLSSKLIRCAAVIAMLLSFVVVGWAQYDVSQDGSVKSVRNFYGTLRMKYPAEGIRAIYSGSVIHGSQFVDPDLRREPTLYYTRDSGVGRVLQTMSEPAGNDQANKGLDVALVGLGAGTLATYGTEKDRYHFFEINPLVVEMAQEDFTFLSDCPAETELILGDGRLSLERFEMQSLDVLVLDAFSGDAVPTHLLTNEAFELYLEKLRPGGCICVHTSNRHLQLSNVVAGQAIEHGLVCRGVATDYDFGEGNSELSYVKTYSQWILLHRTETFFDAPLLKDAFDPLQGVSKKEMPVWTDRHCNVLEILSRN